jgi:uncharacterized protein YwqG
VAASEAQLVELAHHHLPPALAQRWTALIRPGMELHAAGPGEQRVGQLGGLPSLPDDMAWPVWDGEGSLGFIASIDCAQLPPGAFDIAIPDSGTLLFFYFDSSDGIFDPDQPPKTVGVWDPSSLAGAQVIYIPAGTPITERAAPSDITAYEFVPLSATPIFTGPDWSHSGFRAACHDLPAEDRAFLDDHANGDNFVNALRELAPLKWHHIGGHALPVQDAVEYEVAQAQLGVQSPFDDQTIRALHEEAQHWTPLLQIDSDDEAEMSWGDLGTLYWLIRPDDLASQKFESASFTWQCT